MAIGKVPLPLQFLKSSLYSICKQTPLGYFTGLASLCGPKLVPWDLQQEVASHPVFLPDEEGKCWQKEAFH